MTKQWTWAGDEAALKYALPLAAFLLALLIMLALRHGAMKWLRARARAEGAIGSIVLDTLRFPSVLWSLIAAVQVGLDLSIIPEKYAGRASNAIFACLIVSVCMVLASVLVRALTVTGRRRGIALATAGLAQTLIRVFIFTCGAAAVRSGTAVSATVVMRVWFPFRP